MLPAPARHILGLFAALALGCGGSSGTDGGSRLTVVFELEAGGARAPCASRAEVEAVEVSVFTPDRLTRRAGFPISASCAEGSVLLPELASGEHVVVVSALGTLAGEARAVLFSGEASVTAPAGGPVSLALAPQVAYLEVAWTFEELGLMPCASEVGEVEVLLSAGPQAAFRRRFPCAATPATIPVPLPASSFIIQVDAYSPEGFILFSATERRTLERGNNALSARLAALGSRLFLDWSFQLDAQPVRPCDDARVGVTELRATVRNLDGGPAATEVIPCAEVRPHVFGAQRYRPGSELEVELVAEGARARFRGLERFTMPAGDRLTDPPLLLEAVGSATLEFSIGRPECQTLAIESFEVQILEIVGQSPPVDLLTRQLPSSARTTRFDDLPYGEYEVRLSAEVGGQVACESSGRRVIGARESAWEPFIL